jgi:kynureninase
VANSLLDRSFAQECDAADPLARFRDRFVRDDPSLIYLDGNSLGMLPVATAERIGKVVRGGWGRGLIRSWITGSTCRAGWAICSATTCSAPRPAS